MSGLRTQVHDYLTVRRALGFKLDGTGRLLEQFVDFADAAGADTITTTLALRWATLPEGGSAVWHAQRLSVVRCLARYLATRESDTEVPPAYLLPARTSRAIPYLYSDADIAAMMDAARHLRSPLAAATMETLIGLLFTTGLRIGEALGLDRDNLDQGNGILTIDTAKFNKPRQLPLHASTAAALTAYATRRDQLCPHPRTPGFFVSTTGARLSRTTASEGFRRLLSDTGIASRSPRCHPRIHDARHSFAVATLLGWYRDGADVPALLPLLSTYLGHADPRHTYWYLSAAPELLGLAADRLERMWEATP